jgi:Ran GTPase-activating protein (RanGAP) involved in mRNA processing and transport
LDIGKNFIKSSIGPSLKRYVEVNKLIRQLNLEYNEISAEGTETFFEGVINSQLEDINLRGNAIGDRGLALIEEVLAISNKTLPSLQVLNFSTNDITRDGVKHLLPIINCCRLKTLNLSKNLLSDEGVIELIDSLRFSSAGDILERLDLSGCKISDRGFLHMVENVGSLVVLRYLRVADNYISEKYEKIYAELLHKNTTLISLNLHGNRLSLSGLKAIKRIIDKNHKEY